MDIIWLLIRASWVKVTMAIAAGLISGGCIARVIALINAAITDGATTNAAIIEEVAQPSLLLFSLLVTLALTASLLSQSLLIDLSQDTVYKLRLQLSQQILASPLQQLEQLGPSQLLATLSEDVQAIANTVFILPNILINIAVIAGCLVYLGWLSGGALLVVVVFLAAAIAIVQALLTTAYRYLALARKEKDHLFKHFRAVTEGTKELKLHAIRRQIFLEEDLQPTAAASRDLTKTAFKVGALSAGSGQLLFFALIGLLLFGSTSFIPNMSAVLPAYILTITYLLGPIESTIDRLPNIAMAGVALQKVNSMGLALSKTAEITSVVRQPIGSDWKTLALKNVAHTYRTQAACREESADGHFSVGPINLTLKAGELVFIVGGNGSGKSTLAKLITGLYVPASGSIRLDSQPIVDTNRSWYRQHFSAVFSDFYLFERLVSAEALTLDSQAQTYLKKLQLEDKVSVQSGQLSTTALSQGQRKRLSLLTAYLEDRPIYLFDEWAADQDPVFREIFYTQLLAELKARGKTILVISHDDHYFHVADRIIKLDYGRIESDRALKG
ncbi:MAG: cyclic peptide export ABC transporter [Cyanobacteria bacterium P01_A01_bin.116]